MSTNIRVLLADDDERYAKSLQRFLGVHEGLEVVGTASDGGEAARLYGELKPDVVIMDAMMPHMDGIAGTSAIVIADPSARVLMLTAHESPDLMNRSGAAGARAFVSKAEAPDKLVPAVRSLMR